MIDTARAAKLCALHEAAEAAGFNGVQVVAELNRTVVEQGKDWDAAYRVALRFYQREWAAAAAPTRVRTRTRVGELWAGAVAGAVAAGAALTGVSQNPRWQRCEPSCTKKLRNFLVRQTGRLTWDFAPGRHKSPLLNGLALTL